MTDNVGRRCGDIFFRNGGRNFSNKVLLAVFKMKCFCGGAWATKFYSHWKEQSNLN